MRFHEHYTTNCRRVYYDELPLEPIKQTLWNVDVVEKYVINIVK